MATVTAQSDTTRFLERAREFVAAAYPELSSRPAMMLIRTEPYSLDVTWPSSPALVLEISEDDRVVAGRLIDLLTERGLR
jgi:hypothetical protein